MSSINIILNIYETKNSILFIGISVVSKYKILVVILVHFNMHIIPINNLLVYPIFLFNKSIAITSLKNPFTKNILISSILSNLKISKI